jgi:hypothetical protein
MRVIIVESTTPVEDVGTVEMLLLAKNQLKVIDEGYQELGLQTPEWVSQKQLDVAQEITSRVRAELTRQLKTYKARRAAEAPKEERLAFLDTKITELEKKLTQ